MLEDVCTCLDSLAALLSLGYKLVGLRVVHLDREICDYVIKFVIKYVE